jgi:hypothetical protein
MLILIRSGPPGVATGHIPLIRVEIIATPLDELRAKSVKPVIDGSLCNHGRCGTADLAIPQPAVHVATPTETSDRRGQDAAFIATAVGIDADLDKLIVWV